MSRPAGEGKWARLRHAFAVDRPDEIDLDAPDRDLIDRLCAEVVRRRLTTPALLVLEMNRPFNYVSAQTLHFFEPLVSIVADTGGYRAFARFLEHRGSIDHLVSRIEALDAGRTAPEPPGESSCR